MGLRYTKQLEATLRVGGEGEVVGLATNEVRLVNGQLPAAA